MISPICCWKSVRRVVLCLFFGCCFNSLSAQSDWKAWQDSADSKAKSGQLEEAMFWLQKVSSWHLQQGDCEAFCATWALRFAVMVNGGNATKVRGSFVDSLGTCFQQLQNDSLKFELLSALAWSNRALRDFETAGKIYEQGLEIASAYPVLQVKALMGLSVTDRVQNRLFSHRQRLKEATRILVNVPSPQSDWLRVDLLSFYGKSYYQDNDHERAVEYGWQALQLAEKIGVPAFAKGSFSLNLSKYLYQVEKRAAADSILNLAHRFFSEAISNPYAREFQFIYGMQFSKAVEYGDSDAARKAMLLHEEIDAHLLPPGKTNIRGAHMKARYFEMLGQEDSSMVYYEKSLENLERYPLGTHLLHGKRYARALNKFGQRSKAIMECGTILAAVEQRMGTLDNPVLLGDVAHRVAHIEFQRAQWWFQSYQESGENAILDSCTLSIDRALRLHHGRILIRLSSNFLGESDQMKGLYALSMRVYQAQYQRSGDLRDWQRAIEIADAANTIRLSGLMAMDEAREELSDSLLLHGDQLWSELSQLRLAISRASKNRLQLDSLKDQFAQKQIAYDLYQQRLLDKLPDFTVFQNNLQTEVYQPAADCALVQWLQTDSGSFALVAGPGGHQIHELSDNWTGHLSAFLKGIKKNNKAQMAKEGHRLYQELLSPLLPTLGDATTWTLVPSGDFFHLPFSALLEKVVSDPYSPFSSWPFLVKRHSIDYRYSTSLLPGATLEKKPNEQLQFLGFAPVFMKPGDIAASNANLRNEEAEQEKLAPLPGTALEVTRIRDRLEKKGMSTTIKVYNEARESEFKTMAAQYDVIHLASHGFAPKTDPKLSNLAFAMPDSLDDGFLFTTEVYRMELNARLVVVSSCESGAGEVFSGEGLVGFGHGLLFAGAEQVLVSRWKIYDDHTLALMDEFYTRWPEQKEALALAMAQRSMLNNPLTSSPKIWASFTLLQR